MNKQKLTGLEEWKTLNPEQKNLVTTFFKNYCDVIKCKNMKCNNSPYSILKCKIFKRWLKEMEKEKQLQRQKEVGSQIEYLKFQIAKAKDTGFEGIAEQMEEELKQLEEELKQLINQQKEAKE